MILNKDGCYVPAGSFISSNDDIMQNYPFKQHIFYRNKDENLATLTGGIYVSIDSDIMESIPSGRHFYSLEIFNGNTFSDTLLRGRFELSNEDGGLL
jgi:hypothetical protein